MHDTHDNVDTEQITDQAITAEYDNHAYGRPQHDALHEVCVFRRIWFSYL